MKVVNLSLTFLICPLSSCSPPGPQGQSAHPVIHYNFLDAPRADCWTYKPQPLKTTTKAKPNNTEAAHPIRPIPIAPQTAAMAQTSSYTDGDALAPTKANEIPATVTLQTGMALATATTFTDGQ